MRKYPGRGRNNMRNVGKRLKSCFFTIVGGYNCKSIKKLTEMNTVKWGRTKEMFRKERNTCVISIEIEHNIRENL